MNFLIVRLGALGDIVHTVPAAAALRARLSRRAHRLARRRAAMRAFVELVHRVDRDHRARDGRPWPRGSTSCGGCGRTATTWRSISRG